MALMYIRILKAGKRTINQVPKRWRDEVIEILVNEGLYELAGVEPPKEDKEEELENEEEDSESINGEVDAEDGVKIETLIGE